jgi:hypothetical protein
VPELTGSVDARGCPLLRLRVAGKDDDLLVIIDTAFTGELLLQHADAVQWGVLILDVEASIELGDGTRGIAKQGLVALEWLGRPLDVTVQVPPEPATRPARTRQADEPIGLLGTALLRDVVPSIDFPRSSVTLQFAP